MKKLMKFACVLLVLVLLTGCSVLGRLGQYTGSSDFPQSITGKSQTKLEELQALLEEKFIGEVPDDQAFEDAAAAAMVDALGDRWSYYISADEYQDYAEQMANAYVGIGITITQREDGKGFNITKVEKGSPALEVGILPGDILTHAEGQEVAQLGMDGTADIIKGEEGTTVNITVERDGKSMELTVERRTIEVEVASGQLLDNKIGLVKIVNFDERCAQETIAIIEALMDQGAEKLIFDVRYNPGGYAHEMVEVLDYLLPKGDLFISEDYMGNREVDPSDSACLELPMAVLVNADSYSAAEFFAAALRDYDWATVVGEQTIGKGYFQRAYMLSDGSAVNLSVGKYYTPGGVNLAGVGITPDVPVEVDDQLYMDIYYGNVAAENDPQIQAAVKALLGE